MAIVQISQIKHRRGLGTPPQLASAELGYSVDTGRLYIGNGTLTEGAPEVGVTEVVTSRSFNNFALASQGSGIQVVRMYIQAGNYRDLVAISGIEFMAPPITTQAFVMGTAAAPAAPGAWIAYQYRAYTGNADNDGAASAATVYSRSGQWQVSNVGLNGTNSLNDYSEMDDYTEAGSLGNPMPCVGFRLYSNANMGGIPFIRFENNSTYSVEVYYYFNNLFYAGPANQYRDPGIDTGVVNPNTPL